jgi:ABC-2 type transport system permease protein
VSRVRSVYLVARREVLERGRSRGYVISLLFTILLLGASFVLPVLFNSNSATLRIGIVQPEPPGLRQLIDAAATQYEARIAITDIADRAAGEAAIEAETIAALLVVPADITGAGTVVVQRDAPPRTQAILSAAVIALRQQALLAAEGIDPADFAAASQPPSFDALNPQTDEDETNFIFANAGIILMFIGIFSYGTWVLTGVVEEKQSRVVEVVLSTVRPRDLLMGKVLGIGLLALGQLVILVAVGIAAARLFNALVLPATIPLTVALFLIWFVLGFALYATTLGFLGSLASRMEEASNASTPVTMVAIVSYFASIFIASSDPDGTVATLLTFFPPAAPMVVPLRAALDAIQPWEMLASGTLTIAAIFALFVVGGRIYSGAVLQSGGRMKLRDAWRLAGR